MKLSNLGERHGPSVRRANNVRILFGESTFSDNGDRVWIRLVFFFFEFGII